MRFAATRTHDRRHDRRNRGVRSTLLVLTAALGAWSTPVSAQDSAGADQPQAQAQPQESAEPQRLRRVEWTEEPQVQTPAKPLAPEVALLWSERLADPNLDQRERALDELVQAALIDPSLAAHVRAEARGQGEQAWTWRMVRRELDRSARVTLQRQTANDPFQSLLRPVAPDPSQAFDNWLRNVDPFFGWDPLSNNGAPQPFKPLIQFQVPDPAAFEGKSIRVTRLPEGVRIVISEQGPDGAETTEYEGPSVDAIREEHPELRALLGEAGTGLGLGDILPQRLGWPSNNNFNNSVLNQPMRTDRLGVWCEKVEPGDEAEDGGVRAIEIVPLSLAQILGIEPGDILVELLGLPLREVDDISRALATREEGQEIQAKWISDGRTQTGTWRPGPEARDR